ncbi:acetylglutamate kinase [Clostridium arbusti]|uniref:acetylglutamate kinase n=1 Tax=Clostridium arbusti TaxID=1137848 RepID=UPI000288BF74|nr:acetylglutamate kinase [Clostridium arbusti]
MKKEDGAVSLEPLPVLSSLRGKTFVIKYGGSIMKNEEAKNAFLNDVAMMREYGVNIVIVHGGGPLISKWLNKTGIESKFINGLRVTDENVMEIVQMVLCGMVNKDIALNLSLRGLDAIGLSGIDSNLIEARKKYVYNNGEKIDIGFVGEVTNVNETILVNLIKAGEVPVVSPVGYDREGNKYNINADYAASFISSAINADKLIILTDVEGVYKDINDKNSLISYLTLDMIDNYIKEGIISGGMIPKMECCREAIKNGTNKVHLIDGRKEHCLINDIFNNNGTIIEEKGGEEQCQKAI